MLAMNAMAQETMTMNAGRDGLSISPIAGPKTIGSVAFPINFVAFPINFVAFLINFVAFPIVSVAFLIVSVTLPIASETDTIVPVTEAFISIVDTIVSTTDTSFLATEPYAVAEKTAGAVPAGSIQPSPPNRQLTKQGDTTMANKFRTLIGFSKHSVQQLVATAGAVIQGMTGNKAFPSPSPDLTAVQAALNELNAAIAAQPHGGAKATADKNNKREALIGVLQKLVQYVQLHCGNDLAVLLSSGFSAASTSRTQVPLPKPAIVSVDNGNTTEL